MSLIQVDRSKPFDQKRFFCEQHTAHRVRGAEAIGHIDLSRADFIDSDATCDPSMTHLDLSCFAALWNYRSEFPEFPFPTQRIFHFCLLGEALVNQHGVENYFYIRWTPDWYNAKHEQPLNWIWAWDLAPRFNKWTFPLRALVVPRN